MDFGPGSLRAQTRLSTILRGQFKKPERRVFTTRTCKRLFLNPKLEGPTAGWLLLRRSHIDDANYRGVIR